MKVGIIADGLDVKNPDFVRADGSHVITDYQDFTGQGLSAPTDSLEAFLDASSIVAQGRRTYNVAPFGIQHFHQACKIRILGVAPGATLDALKVFGSSGTTFDSNVLEAIDYAVTVDHVDVLSESFSENAFPNTSSLDLVDQADEAAVAAGVTVVSGSGDAGPTDTIGSPGSDPEVLNVGASTTFRIYDQTGLDGVDDAPVDGWLNDNISSTELSWGGRARVDGLARRTGGHQLGAVYGERPEIYRMHLIERQAIGRAVQRRHERVGPPDCGSRCSGHPGLRRDPRRGASDAGAGPPDPPVDSRRHRCAG